MHKLTTQTTIKININLNLQHTNIETTQNIQQPYQITQHLNQPITQIKNTELQHNLPINTINKTNLNHPFNTTLTNHQLQLQQTNLTKITDPAHPNH